MWFYQGIVFNEADVPEDVIGFVYLITRLDNGKRYIGKKLFKFSRTKRVKGKKTKFKIVSDWESYYGSNKELTEDVKQLGPEAFKREIIHLGRSKGDCSYLETKEIILRNALLSDSYYNSWFSAKISTSHLKGLKNDYEKEQKEAIKELS